MIESLPSLSLTFHNQLGDHLPQQGWSKWGGPVWGLLKEELDEWYCQVCGEKQLKIFPSYMIPLDSQRRDFARVCVWCKAKARMKGITFFEELTIIIRHN